MSAETATQHMDPVVARRLRRGQFTHLEREGTRRKDGPPVPGFYEGPTVLADTVCGLRLPPTHMTKVFGVNVTCPACSGSSQGADQ